MEKGIGFDAHGIEYHRWVSDIEQTFIAKDLTGIIFPNPTREPPHKRTKSQALMFLRKHIDWITRGLMTSTGICFAYNVN